MAFNLSGLSNLFEQVDTHIESILVVDGTEYEIEQFNIGFVQSVDYKGKPQHEVRGGQLTVTLTQNTTDQIYDWARMPYRRKDGKVQFMSKTQGTVLEISFTNAYCVGLAKKIGSNVGTATTITIAPETVTMNGVTHNNHWRY